MVKNKPVSEIMHYQVTKLLKRYEVKTVVDIGGTGKLDGRFEDVVNANVECGIDGTNLPYGDGSFDASVSIATLEHVDNQIKFLSEAIRVAKVISVHWFHYGKLGGEVEVFKKKLGHSHPCKLPCEEKMLGFLESIPYRYYLWPFVTCSEHLLMLATMNPKLNVEELYKFVDERKGCIGVILEVFKDC